MKPNGRLALVSITYLATFSIANQGVTKSEIVIGTIQDMSGPLASFGKQAKYGMQLRIDEVNEQGGVHGRKLKLLLDDSDYDPKKAVLGAQKLVKEKGAKRVCTICQDDDFGLEVQRGAEAGLKIINKLPTGWVACGPKALTQPLPGFVTMYW